MQAEPVDVLDDQADELTQFSDVDVERMLAWSPAELAVAQLCELRAMRCQLDRFAQLGDAMAAFGAGGGGMLGRLLGMGGT